MRNYIFLFIVFGQSMLHGILYAHPILKPIEKAYVKGGVLKMSDKKITINSFQIAKYEVTNEAYAIFLNESGIKSDGLYHGIGLINISSNDLQIVYTNDQWVSKQGFEHYPMVMVNYYGASQFCSWVGGRLPNTLEWTYAANGGEKNIDSLFAGGNELDKLGWSSANSENHAHPVGQKKPNVLDIYDMSGNAWEWCYNDSLKSNTDFCVHMGGSWFAGEKASMLNAHYGNIPTHFSNSVGFRVLFPIQLNNNSLASNFKKYQGRPWNNTIQVIPGKIQAEWYDLGGEAVAYHDHDSINNGSGKLNPVNGTLLNEFRLHEGVDISYTKAKDIDNNPFNIVEPQMGELYTGWTVPGEWMNYTIKVNQSGMYSLGLMYTASGDGGISLLMDGQLLTNELLVPSTRNSQEPITWRQWHHWNKIDSIAKFQLGKGIHVLTLKTNSNGNMNYDFLEFKLIQ